jgi:hypothetical protein
MAIDDAVFKCFRRFRLMFQTFHLDVAKVDQGCFICCNDNIHVFQVYVQNVSVILDVCFKCFRLDVAYVAMAAHACFKYLFSCVSDLYCKVDLHVAYVAMAIYACFNSMFQMYHLF